MNRDPHPAARSEHLDEAEFIGFAQGQLADAAQVSVLEHVEHCSRCAAELEGYLELDENDVQWSEQDAARMDQFARDLLAAPPLPEQESKLLELFGRPESLNELALSSGVARATLQRDLELLGETVTQRYPQLLAGAEAAARALTESAAFERWKVQGLSGAGNIERAPHVIALHRWIPEVARSEDALTFQEFHRTEPEYSLCIRELREGDRWSTALSCVGPDTPPWGFRLVFRPEDEQRALEERGLSQIALGALRAAYGRDSRRWRRLLDLLIPCRYGSERSGIDPVFSRAVRESGVEGRLPGVPEMIYFWLFPR